MNVLLFLYILSTLGVIDLLIFANKTGIKWYLIVC